MSGLSAVPPQVLLGLPNVFTQPQTMSRLNSTGDIVISPDGTSRWIFEGGTLLIATGAGFWTNPDIQFSGSVTLNAAAYGGVPASSNPTIASGAVYQNTTGRYVSYDVSCYATTAGTSGTIAFARGTTSTPTAVFTDYVSGSTSSTATVSRHLFIPPGWYWSVTLTGATLGTVTEVEA